MRKALYISVLLIAASCQGIPAQREEKGTTVRITAIATPGTKSVPGETQIGSMAAWIYSSRAAYDQGLAAESFAFSQGNSVTLDCTRGSKLAVVVTNLPQSQFNTSQPLAPANLGYDLKSARYSLESMMDNGFLMHGSLAFSSDQESADLPVVVTRAVCKVSLGSVRNSLQEKGWAGKDVQVEDLFLVNGVSGAFPDPFMAGAQPSVGDFFWCSAKYSPRSGPYPDFGQDEGPECAQAEVSGTISPGMSMSIDAALYCCPNPTEDDTQTLSGDLLVAAAWAPRHTRLVLQCSIDGHRCYYPVTLPALEENVWYKIEELVIKHFGTDSPDAPLSFTDVGITAHFGGWDGLSINETL
ncbi:MAG: hypothetical protein IJ795_01750 [Bacteroidales bacterium]|nr:hypothetical protein [Bacteroidales bacterium]